mgnify:CR=1 FL=1
MRSAGGSGAKHGNAMAFAADRCRRHAEHRSRLGLGAVGCPLAAGRAFRAGPWQEIQEGAAPLAHGN